MQKGINIFQKRDIPVFKNIEVSIIIPVKNHFEDTYQCIDSIIKNTKKVNYEIILIDDASNDETINIFNYFTNIVYLKNNINLGFILTCNKASLSAKGEFILFLNNDTQVIKENWLFSMVEVFRNHKNVGVVGSKLLYPDKSLQEAGGIIWKDGNGWNFGKACDPNEPIFNYLRETDYVSGASLLIKKSLFFEVNKFSEYLTIAYFEDTDLCFKVRQLGYKVIYQPLSEVIHFEGKSSGTDLTKGVKQYQLINKKNFIEHWQSVLNEEHFNDAEHVFLAHNRSRNKKHILMVDHYLPKFDMNAGDRSMFQTIKILLELNIQITFIPDNFHPHEPYLTILQQLGVEVLYGNKMAVGLEDWFKNHHIYFDKIIVSRPHIAPRYITILKKIGYEGEILYIPHDMSYFRLKEQYKFTFNIKHIQEALVVLKNEIKLFIDVDKILLHSINEKETIKKITNLDSKIESVPPYFFDFDGIENNFDATTTEKSILFIGGYAHPPNINAMEWFLEKIFSKIISQHPDIIFYMIGSEMPEKLKCLSKKFSKNIKTFGQVTDEELKTLYQKTRISIAPLTFGAGVKGKVVEAMYYGLPVIGTKFAFEGMPKLENEKFFEADDEIIFAKMLNSTIGNYNLLNKQSKAQYSMIKSYFSIQNGKKIWKKIID